MLPVLPTELFCNIFHRLDFDDLVSARSTCKSWYTAIPTTSYQPRLTYLMRASSRGNLEHTLHNFPKTVYNQLQWVADKLHRTSVDFVWSVVKIHPRLLECNLAVIITCHCSHHTFGPEYKDMHKASRVGDYCSCWTFSTLQSKNWPKHPRWDSMRKVMDILAGYAFEKCDHHILDYLIKKNPWRMCYLAAFYSRWDIVESLLKRHSDLDMIAFNNCLFKYAIRDGQLDFVKSIMSISVIGIDPKAHAREAIEVAAQRGHLPLVLYLLDWVDFDDYRKARVVNIATSATGPKQTPLDSIQTHNEVIFTQCVPVKMIKSIDVESSQLQKGGIVDTIEYGQECTEQSDYYEVTAMIGEAIDHGNGMILEHLFAHPNFKSGCVDFKDYYRINEWFCKAASQGHVDIFHHLVQVIPKAYHHPAIVSDDICKKALRAVISSMQNSTGVCLMESHKEMMECVVRQVVILDGHDLTFEQWHLLLKPEFSSVVEEILERNDKIVFTLVRVAIAFGNDAFLTRLTVEKRERLQYWNNVKSELAKAIRKGYFKVIQVWVLDYKKDLPPPLAQAACREAILAGNVAAFNCFYDLYSDIIVVDDILNEAIEQGQLAMVQKMLPKSNGLRVSTIQRQINVVTIHNVTIEIPADCHLLISHYFNRAIQKRHFRLAKYLISHCTDHLPILNPIPLLKTPIKWIKWLFSVYGAHHVPIQEGKLLESLCFGVRCYNQKEYESKQQRMEMLQVLFYNRHPILLRELMDIDLLSKLINSSQLWIVEYLMSFREWDFYDTMMDLLLQQREALLQPRLFVTSLCDPLVDPNCMAWSSTEWIKSLHFIVSVNDPRLGVSFYSKALCRVCDAEREAIDHVRLLLSLGRTRVDPFYNDNEPLRMAAKHGHLSIIKLLVKCGADPLAEQHYALRIAVEKEYVFIIEYLLSLNEDSCDEIAKIAKQIVEKRRLDA